MIKRDATDWLKNIAGKFSIVTLTGPRQSGKTTLARSVFPQLPYFNFENLETLALAKGDPLRFLKSCPEGSVIDEVQNFPEILSYIQVITDEAQRPGMFILIGSSQFDLMSNVPQSLAGRTAFVKLLPLSMSELQGAGIQLGTDELLFTGFYPRIYDKKIDPTVVYSSYVESYIDKDIRQFAQIQNISLFHKFIRLCAGRVGGLLNLSSLAADTGISHTTAQHWLSMLQAGYVIFLLEPYFANINKRLIKSPKLFFYDVGLATYLMGIEEQKQIKTHPLRGNLFENLVILEVLKYRYNKGKGNNLNFYRDSNGNEVDLIYNVAQHLFPIEIKSGETIASDFFKGLKNIGVVFKEFPYGKALIYGGDQVAEQQDISIRNYSVITQLLQEKGV